MRQINFFDGAQSGTVPTIGSVVASNLVQYADDAAYEAAEPGSPTEGNIYYNTTSNLIRYYNGTAWITLVDETSIQTIENKDINGGAGGNNWVINTAGDTEYNPVTSGLAATNVQAAIDEVDGRLDTAETDINTLQSDMATAQSDISTLQSDMTTAEGRLDDLEALSGSPGATDHGTFTGSTIPDAQTTKGALQALETAHEGATSDIADIRTLSGTSDGETDLGTFTGTTIANNESIKGALQSLEMEVEAKLDASEKGAVNGVAELDGTGKVPAAQLPSYVDDVLEYANFAALPGTGETGKIYVTLDDNKTYRWTGSVYIEVSAGGVTSVNSQTGTVSLDTDDIPEGATNKYANGSIDTHSDVDTTTSPPATNDLLKWDGTNWVPGAAPASGANTTLSNLTSPTAVNQHLRPDGYSTRDLGALGGFAWRDIYAAGIAYIEQGLTNVGSAITKIFSQDQSGASTGAINIYTGNVTSGNGDSGKIELKTGNKSGTGTRGSIAFRDGSEGQSGKVWKSNGLLGEGTWSDDSSGKVSFFGDYECDNIANVLTYQDGGATPTDGDGGTVSWVTKGTETTSPLSGLKSYSLQKTSGNAQGEGWAIATNNLNLIAKNGEPVWVDFRYAISNTSFAQGDVTVWVYLPNTSKLYPLNTIQGSSITNQLPYATNGRYGGWFNAASGDTYARLIFHVATTNSAAYNITVDTLTIGLVPQVQSGIDTQWKSTAVSLSGVTMGTGGSAEWKMRRDGPDLLLRGYIVLGTGGSFSGTLAGTLPESLQADLANVADQASGYARVGYAWASDTGSTGDREVYSVYLPGTSATTFQITGRTDAGTIGVWNSTFPFTWAAGDEFGVDIRVPISGWTQGNTMSTAELQVRSAVANYSTNAGQSIPNSSSTIIDFEDKITDTHNAVTTGASWKFTAQSKGNFLVCSKALFVATTTWAEGEIAILDIYKNGVFFRELCRTSGHDASSIENGVNGATIIPLEKDEYFDIRILQNTGASLSLYSGGQYNHVSITQLPDLTVVGAMGTGKTPTVQRLTSGSGATYTTPSGVKYLKIKMIGGGGGGSGSAVGASNAGAGSSGGNSLFGTSLLTAGGGGGGNAGTVPLGGQGGTNTINSPAINIVNTNGSRGEGGMNTGAASVYAPGGNGANTPMGAGGYGIRASSSPGSDPGAAASANTGAGGGAPATSANGSSVSGAGGGGGGYLEAIIENPSQTYTYTIGGGGAGGSAGTSGGTGGAGGSGIIIVEEHYY